MKNKGNERMVLVCPTCLSRDIRYVGDFSGVRYECPECGYLGALVLEVDEGFEPEAAG